MRRKRIEVISLTMGLDGARLSNNVFYSRMRSPEEDAVLAEIAEMSARRFGGQQVSAEDAQKLYAKWRDVKQATEQKVKKLSLLEYLDRVEPLEGSKPS